MADRRPTKRERKDEAKKRRLEEMRRRRRRARRRKLTTYAIVGAIIAAVVGAVLLSKAASNRAKSRATKLAAEAGCTAPSGDLKIEGSTHVPTNQTVQYQTDPPTSGNHWASGTPPLFAPSPTGILAQPVRDEQAVHNLEHGHIVVSYQPGVLSAAVLKKVEDVVRANGTTMLMAPRQNRDSVLAITAWGRLQKCQAPTEKIGEAVKDFHKRFVNQAPEKAPFPRPIFQTSSPAPSPKPTAKTTRKATASPKPTARRTTGSTAPATPG